MSEQHPSAIDLSQTGGIEAGSVVRTNLRVEVVIETTERNEFVVAEVAFVPVAPPCRFIGLVFDDGRTYSVSKDGLERDSAGGVFGSYQTVHHVSIHLGKSRTGGALEVLCDRACIAL